MRTLRGTALSLSIALIAPSTGAWAPRISRGLVGRQTTVPIRNCSPALHRAFRTHLFLATTESDPVAVVIDSSNDPFVILGLSTPTADQKEIKRAYKRMALKYHPDVSADTDKKVASDRFAKINWAYQQLSGDNKNASRSSTSKTASSSSSSSSNSWSQPPHRRTASSSSSYSGPSVDWRDYMPNNGQYDQQYDAGGDSFASIFRDLFAGAAVGGYSVVNDLLEFMERSTGDASFGGFGKDANNDAELRVLLQTGTLREIGQEMEDTELVVDQLAAKLRKVQDERTMAQADLSAASRYMEKLEIDERLEELNAREKVVEGYLKKARKRLLQLQTRYKEMIVHGQDDVRARSASSRTWNTSRSSQSTTAAADSSRSSTASSESPSAGSSSRHADPADAWKDDSFGSFGRRRGSGRRRSSASTSSTRSETSPGSSSSASSTRDAASASSSSYAKSPSQSSSTSRTASSTSTNYDLPPHRRIMSDTSGSRNDRDLRRLRELKVDEEFEKLKKELGL